ncbi:MAG TPA: Trp biosynthesis-associated membrane protein [Streptosporangiaceae bacterium]
MSARREYVLCLLLGAVGAGLVLLSARQGWARVFTPAPAPLPASSVSVTGQDLVPLAGALALASLAGLLAVAATRRRVRRFTGLLLAAFGLAMAVAVGTHTTTASVLSASHANAVSQAGSATAGGTSGVAPGTIPGDATPGLTTAGHVTFAGFPWQDVALAGALLVIAAGLLTAWRGGRWPAMSGRYERAPRSAADPGAGPPPDAAGLWDALSRGADPTDRPPSHPPHAGGTARTEQTGGTPARGSR